MNERKLFWEKTPNSSQHSHPPQKVYVLCCSLATESPISWLIHILSVPLLYSLVFLILHLTSPSRTITLGCFSTSSPSCSSSASSCSTCLSGWWWRTFTSAGSTRRRRRPGVGRRSAWDAWRKSAGVRRYTCLVGRLRYKPKSFWALPAPKARLSFFPSVLFPWDSRGCFASLPLWRYLKSWVANTLELSSTSLM